MVRLSILIPAIGTQSQLDDTLVSVLENRPQDCEVVVVHPRSYVDPYNLEDEIRFAASTQSASLAMINEGFAACRGELIHLLCPGALVDAGWCEPALELFAGDRNVATLAPELVVRGRSRIHGVSYDVSHGQKLQRRASCLPMMPTLQAGFFQATAIRFMDGFDLQYGSLAEVELGFRLRAAGYKTLACSDCRIQVTMANRRRPLRGFAGGQARAQLFQLARRAGLVTNRSYPLSLLGELPLHAFRFSTVNALAGHVAVWLDRSSPEIVSYPDRDDRPAPREATRQAA